MTRGRRRRREPSTSSSSTTSRSSSSSTDCEVHRRRRMRKRRKGSPTVSQSAVLSSVIPEFDPLVDDIDMWINVLDANARAFGWSDSMIKFQGLQKLRNTAKTWLDSLQKNETSWTEWRWKDWRDRLSNTFQIKCNMYILLKQLIETKPLPNQTLYEFYFVQKGKIDRLQLNFKDRDIVSIIVGSIGDPNICTAAEARNFPSCDDLVSFLHSKIHTVIDNSVNANKNNLGPKSNNRSVPFRQNNLNNKPEFKTEPSSSNNTNYTTNNISCYRCGEIGHRRNDCSFKDDITCALCKKRGHLEKACKSRTKPKIETDIEVKMISEPQSKQKFNKLVILNDFECRAFFDMGSDCSLITTELVKK